MLQEASKMPQEASKMLQEASRMLQEASRMLQEAFRMLDGGFQNGSGASGVAQGRAAAIALPVGCAFRFCGSGPRGALVAGIRGASSLEGASGGTTPPPVHAAARGKLNRASDVRSHVVVGEVVRPGGRGGLRRVLQWRPSIAAVP